MGESGMTKFVGGPLDGAQAKTSALRWEIPIPRSPSTSRTITDDVSVLVPTPRPLLVHVYQREGAVFAYHGEETT